MREKKGGGQGVNGGRHVGNIARQTQHRKKNSAAFNAYTSSLDMAWRLLDNGATANERLAGLCIFGIRDGPHYRVYYKQVFTWDTTEDVETLRSDHDGICYGRGISHGVYTPVVTNIDQQEYSCIRAPESAPHQARRESRHRSANSLGNIGLPSLIIIG